MDDLVELQSRVAAARDRLGDVESDQRKYGLRSTTSYAIVEGALSRQSEELKAARIRSASLQTELDDARNALSRNESSSPPATPIWRAWAPRTSSSAPW